MRKRFTGDVIALRERKLYVLGSRSSYTIPDPSGSILTILNELKDGVTSPRLETLRGRAPSLIKQLESSSMIKPVDGRFLGSSIERSVTYLDLHADAKALTKALGGAIHIAIVGCGGIGANVAYMLAGSGFSKFSLVDGDVVERSNLNRQFPLGARDLGKPKAVALAHELGTLHPHCLFKAHQISITDSESLLPLIENDEIDLIVGAIDTPPILSKLYVAQFAKSCGIPAIFGGVGYFDVNVGPFLDEDAAFDRFIAAQEKLASGIDLNATTQVRGSLPSTNAVASGLLAAEITSHFLKLGEVRSRSKSIVFDVFQMSQKGTVSYEA